MKTNIKKLRKLLALYEKSDAQLQCEGFTKKSLENAIEKQKDHIESELNQIGWFLVFLIVIPLALMQLGMSIESAGFASYMSGGILVFVILPKITGRIH